MSEFKIIGGTIYDWDEDSSIAGTALEEMGKIELGNPEEEREEEHA